MKLHPDVTSKKVINSFKTLESRFNAKHNNKYDYSKVVYINSRTKVKIICPEYGEFERTPESHLRGLGHPKRSKNCKMTQEDFLHKARKAHGDKYDYEKTVYVKSSEKVIVTCRTHGDFKIAPSIHIAGTGCMGCATDNKKDTLETFLAKAKKIHGDRYDYSKVVYESSKKQVDIICKVHGLFSQKAGTHLQGKNCIKCGNIAKSKATLKSTETFIKEAKEVHKDLYSYSNVKYKGVEENVEILCKIHGSFFQTPHGHLKGHICPYCAEIQKQSSLTNKPTRVYYIKIEKPELKHPIYKVGITSKDRLAYRMRSYLKKEDYTVIWMSDYMTRLEAVTKEQKILADNKEFRYRGRDLLKPNGEPFVSREFFIKDVYDKNEGVWNETKIETLPD